MALNEIGCHATSLTGWQAGFHTDRAYTKARIKRMDVERITSELERNRIVVVAGFQGLNKLDDITTLGRGGSDTSAVAIAAALHADRCQIFTDVEGVYTADPRKVRNARKLPEITFDEMLELASLGAQVLNNRSVELAKKYNVELEVLSSLNPVPGTVVKEVAKDMEGMLIKGVAKDTDVAVISIMNVPDEPGMSFKIFGMLAQKKINVGRQEGRHLHLLAGRRPHRHARAQGEREVQPGHLLERVRQGLHRRRRYAEPQRRGRQHVRGPGQQQHQHPHDLDQRDQDLLHHRPRRGRPRRQRHPRQPVPLSGSEQPSQSRRPGGRLASSPAGGAKLRPWGSVDWAVREGIEMDVS